MKSSAVNVLITTPIAATTTTVVPATAAGSRSRCQASQKIAPQATKSRTALASAAKIVARPRPQVYRRDGGRRASQLAPQARSRPTTSLALWPASARSASEPAHTPAAISTTTKPALSPTPSIIARSSWPGAMPWAP